MNFKEALIAHLQGEKVEAVHKASGSSKSMSELLDETYFGALMKSVEMLYTFRLAPRTIFVNGVEVPAPERVGVADGRLYFVAAPHVDLWAFACTWNSSDADKEWLERGLIYLKKEDAIARAKAMLLTSDK